MRNRLVLFILLAFFSFIAFKRILGITYSKRIETTLEVAGDNKKELLKVIDHYKNDNNKYKLKAAIFLLEHMSDQFHAVGDDVDHDRRSFHKMDSLLKSGHGSFNKSWDSIQKIHPPSSNNIELVSDASTIKANFLIRHIDAAFTAWHYPWARSLSFDDFCEYILPYKLKNEEPKVWNEEIQREYSWLSDSMKNSSDSRRACLLINSDLKKRFYLNHRLVCYWDLNYSDLMKVRQGSCANLTQITTYIMRAMGVPVYMEMTSHWANKNSGHNWNGLLYNGKVLHFVGSESDPGKTKLEFTRTEWIRRKVGKVYRRMYSFQNAGFGIEIKDRKPVEELFLNNHLIDVTEQYVPVSNIKLNLKDAENNKYVYLCVFNENTWQTLAIGKIDFFNNVMFNNVGREIVYSPMYYIKEELLPAGPPFILKKDGSMEKLEGKSTLRMRVVLDKKYPEDKTNKIFPNEKYELMYWNDEWKSLGVKVAKADSLVYTNVPSNALLWLKNIDKGKQERIFTYENEKQVWW